jgi:hypothetical protein
MILKLPQYIPNFPIFFGIGGGGTGNLVKRDRLSLRCSIRESLTEIIYGILKQSL